MDLLTDLQAYAEAQVERHKIPAISLALWKGGELYQAAGGILNQSTGVTATTDAIFQIGSITKVMTASLVMQLVDEGRIDLDTPVKHYLRDFQIADPQATQTITVRQLLNHSSGIAGDFFPDDRGHQGNLIARYVDRCSLLPVVHPVGEMYSYCNSAFTIAGRLVEVVRGISWYQAMQDLIFKPLGMTHAIADPKEQIRFRTAMGHVCDGDNTDRWVLPEQAYLSLGQAPCGSTPAMTAADLIRFACAHLQAGAAQSGERWLSPESVGAMQMPSIAIPRVSQVFQRSMGLGWMLRKYHQNGLDTFSHNGATMGFLSTLQVIPQQNAAYAILLNAFSGAAFRAINSDLMMALTGLQNDEPEVPDKSPDTALFEKVVGRYESFDTSIEIALQGDKLSAHIRYKIDPLPALKAELKHIDELCFAVFTERGERQPNLVFLAQDQRGVAQYLFNGDRLNGRL